MIDAELLLTDTKKLVVDLVDDLRAVAANDAAAGGYVDDEYRRAHSAGRTAFGKAEWAEGLFAQVATAWVLGGVFVRFCEDNGLIDEPLLGGPGIRSQLALDQRAEHLRANPEHDDRHWLREVFGRLRALPATGDIFGAHNPVWADGLLPSADGARKLREELSRVDADTGRLRHDFTDPNWDTRFLGDLYQDLSEHAKKTYALLQTPDFVEEFILDRTLEPAVAIFGLADTTIIDPACGSGHFLLGAFRRLFDRWVEAAPTVPRRELAQRALSALGGIDLNPFAVSIARFRLLIAALGAGGDERLSQAPAYEVAVAVGDSLLHGDPPGALPGLHTSDEDELVISHGYRSEDIDQARLLLRRSWSAVVGNPPYIIAHDPAMNAAYRSRFKSCYKKYSLAVPFMERFWQLAAQSDEVERSGFIGMITANSFMRRQMGKRLVEDWVPRHDITHVIDTNSVRMEGHPTPTVIILGRSRAPVASDVRVAMGRRGEPPGPLPVPGGLAWQSIVRCIDAPGSGDEFIDVVNMERSKLGKHPWSLGGSDHVAIKEKLDSHQRRLSSFVETVGFFGISGMEDFSTGPSGVFRRLGFPASVVRLLVGGDAVRDWSATAEEESYFPYDDSGEVVPLDEMDSGAMSLWPLRTLLGSRTTFSGETYFASGRKWWEWHQYSSGRTRDRMLTFAEVATHNHFAIASGDAVFARAAPLLVNPTLADDDQAGLIGLLNSSVANFWARQVFQPRGGGRGASETWQQRIQRDGTKLKQFPVPSTLPVGTALLLDELAIELRASSPSAVIRDEVPTKEKLLQSQARYERTRSRMIAAQEMLDWECYRLFGLVDDDLAIGGEEQQLLALGQRAFEIALARRLRVGSEETTWFDRHGSKPITELPSSWTPEYRNLVDRRISAIENDEHLGLLEQPEFKRRWAGQSWDELVRSALRTWLLDRLEDARYWAAPEMTTIARLTAALRSDNEFLQVARLYLDRDDLDLASLVNDLVSTQAVPYLSTQRLTEDGLRKRAEWTKTWQLQRREDAGESIGSIPPPPRYAKADFSGTAWEHRGALDVPKERFISYPGAERETDTSAVIGWAGWSLLDRARALAAWYMQARRDGRDMAHLTPLLAGLSELVPWLKQWYDEPDADPALDRPGTQIAALVDTEIRSLGLTPEALTEWRPEKKRGGRRRKASS